MDITAFQAVNSVENYVVTRHGRGRMAERGITMRDVVSAVDGGEIIEEYPEDFPFPSCLILGQSTAGRPLHIVMSLDDGRLYLITAYFPDPEQWEKDWKTRKDGTL